MEKKKAIKIATATAIAASAFTAVAPTQSEAATTSLTSQIKTAKATIKKPYDTYTKATKTPATYTTVKNQVAAAKKAKANINAEIKKTKLSTSQKNAIYAEIKAYDQYITRAEGYVAALSISVVGAKNQLATAIASGNDTDKLAKQNALKTKIAEFKTAVAKVYGKNTRSLLLSYYVTPAQKLVDSVVFDVKIESVSALDATNKYLQINFSNPVKKLAPADIQIKDAKKGDFYGVQTVTLSADGKSAQVTLLSNTDTGGSVLEKNTEYTVTVKVNNKTVTSTFFSAAFTEARVTDINVKDKKVTVVDDKTGDTVTLTVPNGTEFDYQGTMGEKTRIWYNSDNEVLKYEVAKKAAKYDAIQIDRVDRIKFLTDGTKVDISKETYSADASHPKKFKFFLDGDLITDLNTIKGKKYNFAKIGYDNAGNIEYVSAYTMKEFLVVDSVSNFEVVGTSGRGTGGSFDSEDATIVKDGKVINRSELKKDDILFFNDAADGDNGFAEVYNKSVTGKIDSVYETAISLAGKIYDYKYDTQVQTDFPAQGYGNAVYIDDKGDTDYIDSDAAEQLQAGGNVTAYFDRAGHLVYVSGDTARFNSNNVSAVLTDDILTDTSFNKDSIQVDVVLADGSDRVSDVALKDLKTLSIDGYDYKIDDKNTNATDEQYVAKIVGNSIVLYNTVADATAKTKAVESYSLTNTKGKAVKLQYNDNKDLEKVELFTKTNIGKVTASTTDNAKDVYEEGSAEILATGTKLQLGDTYAVTDKGSKKLTSKTVIFDATDGYKSSDITATTWGAYKGSDITAADVIYNKDNEVVALVIKKSDANDKTHEEAIITNVYTDTDSEITRVEAYVNGTKQTFTVQKNAYDSKRLVKGSTAVLVFDKNNTTVVKDIYNVDHDSASEYANRTTNLTGLTVNSVDVGNRSVTLSNGQTYKLADNGTVLDGASAIDIKLKALTDLRGKTNVTVVLDENDAQGRFAKFFIYNDKVNPGTPASIPGDVVITSATAVAANNLAALFGAVEYNVEGTVANSANVNKVEVTFSNGTNTSAPVAATVTGDKYKATVSATEMFGNYNKATVIATYKDGSTKQKEASFEVTVNN